MRWLGVLYWIALTAGLLRPYGGDHPTGIDAVDSHSDLAHFLAFVVLGILVSSARFRWTTAGMMATLCAYAGCSELAQMVVPGRTASLVDGSANVLGVVAGVCLCWCFARFFPSKIPQTSFRDSPNP